MDYEDLTKELRRADRYCLNDYSRMAVDAAAALTALLAENEKLRAELEQARTDCAVAEKNHADCIDELEQVKQERDAAISSWHGFCSKCEWRGKQYLDDGQMDARCRTCRKNGKCNWQWRGAEEEMKNG